MIYRLRLLVFFARLLNQMKLSKGGVAVGLEENC